MKIFISDLHLGCGDSLEDFALWEKAQPPQKTQEALIAAMARMHTPFADFIINKIWQTEYAGGAPPELILLGDIFDLLQVLPAERFNPEKIHLIRKAHAPVFEALAECHKKGGAVSYVLGNHDHDMLHPAMFETLKSYLPFLNERSGGAPMLFYHAPQAALYAEHGNQFDVLNAFEDPAALDVLPTGSELTLRLINPLEKNYPAIDNLDAREALWFALTRLPALVSPACQKELLLADEVDGISRGKRLKHLAYFILHQFLPGNQDSLLTALWQLLAENERLIRRGVSPAKRKSGILYTFRSLGRNPLRIFQELLTDRMAGAAKKICGGDVGITIGKPAPAPRLVVFGHTHRPCLKRFKGGGIYANTGTWRMRAIPYGRLDLRYEQTLDYVVAKPLKEGDGWTLVKTSLTRQES